MSGTFNVSRDLWEDTAFRNEPFTQREAWLWLIAEASWKDRARRLGTHTIVVGRGEVAASSRFLAKRWQWSEPRVRRYFDMLEKRRMIARVSDAPVTIISICKYNHYQSTPRVGDAPAVSRPTQDRRTADANEKKGERRKEEGIGRAHAQARDPDPGEVPSALQTAAAGVPSPAPTQVPSCTTQALEVPSSSLDHRKRLLAAMGADPVSGSTSSVTGRALGMPIDVAECDRWRTLGLTDDEQLAEVFAVMATKRDGPPRSFGYFTPAMQRLAARKAQPLHPLIPGASDDRRSRATTRQAAGDERFRALVLAAAEGTTGGAGG